MHGDPANPSEPPCFRYLCQDSQIAAASVPDPGTLTHRIRFKAAVQGSPYRSLPCLRAKPLPQAPVKRLKKDYQVEHHNFRRLFNRTIMDNATHSHKWPWYVLMVPLRRGMCTSNSAPLSRRRGRWSPPAPAAGRRGTPAARAAAGSRGTWCDRRVPALSAAPAPGRCRRSPKSRPPRVRDARDWPLP